MLLTATLQAATPTLCGLFGLCAHTEHLIPQMLCAARAFREGLGGSSRSPGSHQDDFQHCSRWSTTYELTHLPTQSTARATDMLPSLGIVHGSILLHVIARGLFKVASLSFPSIPIPRQHHLYHKFCIIYQFPPYQLHTINTTA